MLYWPPPPQNDHTCARRWQNVTLVRKSWIFHREAGWTHQPHAKIMIKPILISNEVLIWTTRQKWLVYSVLRSRFFNEHFPGPPLMVHVGVWWNSELTHRRAALFLLQTRPERNTLSEIRVGSPCATADQGPASAESATLSQSRGRPYSADQVWPASPYVTYHEAEWQVPCGISTELTARVCNLLQSTLLPGEGPVWHSDLSLKIGQMTQPPSWPRLNIIHHTQWQLLLLEAQCSHLAIK